MQQLAEKDKVETAKRQEELLSKAEKWKEILDQKEEGLRKDEEHIEKEQEVYQWMFMSVQEQMDKAIENNDVVSVKAAREMLNAATKINKQKLKLILMLNESSSLKNFLRLWKLSKLNKSHFISERIFIIFVVANNF